MGSNVLNEIIFRDNFKQYEKRELDISETTNYLKHHEQQRKINLYPIDFNVTPRMDLRNSKFFTNDRYIFNLNKRQSVYELMNQQFGFLRNKKIE